MRYVELRRVVVTGLGALSPNGHDREAYRRRHTVEQCVGWIKECRRIATRFEKLAVNFLAMIHLVFIERYLRLLFSNGA